MLLTEFSLNDVITITVIIAQAGIVYYRLKKVEQMTDRFNDIIIEFAVYKNSLEHHRHEFEKQSSRFETILNKMDKRISGIETHAYQALIKSAHFSDGGSGQ